MKTQAFNTYTPLKAGIEPGAVQGARLVLCCIKSTDTETAAPEMARQKFGEIDHRNGDFIGKGKTLGIPMPVNRVMHSVVKLLESR